MISYLVIGFSRQTIADYNIPDLFDLVGLALASNWLKIENLGNTAPGKDVMAAFNALVEPKKLEKLHQA
jgi:hypothetical protein